MYIVSDLTLPIAIRDFGELTFLMNSMACGGITVSYSSLSTWKSGCVAVLTAVHGIIAYPHCRNTRLLYVAASS